MGFLPAALRNYLLRLGWGHGDDEIIWRRRSSGSTSTASASASRFDMAKLTNLNAHYLRETPDVELLPLGAARARWARPVDAAGCERIVRGLSG